jgi:hypothetical protein
MRTRNLTFFFYLFFFLKMKIHSYLMRPVLTIRVLVPCWLIRMYYNPCWSPASRVVICKHLLRRSWRRKRPSGWVRLSACLAGAGARNLPKHGDSLSARAEQRQAAVRIIQGSVLHLSVQLDSNPGAFRLLSWILLRQKWEHGGTSQKKVIFILVARWNWNLSVFI